MKAFDPGVADISSLLAGISDNLLAQLDAEGREAYWKLLHQADTRTAEVREFVETYLNGTDNEG